MTRKDYISTAEILKEFKGELSDSRYADLVIAFAELFVEDNARFDEHKFFNACQLEGVSVISA